MRLSILEPRLIQLTESDGRQAYHAVATIDEADGVMFLCPTCFHKNGDSAVGTHQIICWSPKVPDHVSPGPGRWSLDGANLEYLTLGPATPGALRSVLLQGGCGAHFHVTLGDVTDA